MLATLTVCHLHTKVENNKNKQPYQLIKPKTSGGRQSTLNFFFFLEVQIKDSVVETVLQKLLSILDRGSETICFYSEELYFS